MPPSRRRPLISCRSLARRWRSWRYWWGPRRAALREAHRRHNRLDAYWWTATVNFGDLLTPELLRHYGHTPILMPPARAQVIGCGSLLEHVPDTFAGVLLGPGFIADGPPRSLPMAHALAVRGHLTRRRLGLPDGVPVGDPGLLIHRLAPRKETPCYELGIVPHFQERDGGAVRRLSERLGNDALVMDVRRPPRAVAADIARCRHILASSLHGLITADALGIPSAWYAPDNETRQNRFKYDDYYSALGIQPDPLRLTGDELWADLRSRMCHNPDSIAAVQDTLHTVFLRLRELFPER